MRDPIERVLTADELRELTGYKLPHHIRNALRKHGIRYIKRRDGWPATTWAAVNAALGGNQPAQAEQEEPDLSFLLGAH